MFVCLFLCALVCMAQFVLVDVENLNVCEMQPFLCQSLGGGMLPACHFSKTMFVQISMSG